MSHIYWELNEIKIPEQAHINKSDGRVFIFAKDSITVRTSSRIVIGRATSETTMHPNDLYRLMFPNEWERNYGKQQLFLHSLHVGFYAATLGIGYKTGLYPMLTDIFQGEKANTLMDYAMFSILESSNSTMHFYNRMIENVVFSRTLHKDSWMSEFFKENDEERNNQFLSRWIDQCQKTGITQAWICIDGSNNDCASKACDLAEKGNAKSKKNVNIVSYMYAVNAEDGTPITYDVYEGSRVDAKAVVKIIELLAGHGIKTKGIIVDRGFATYDVFNLLIEKKYTYVAMLKSNTAGHKTMVNKYANTIHWNVHYAISDNGLFGISEKAQVFSSHETQAFINLFFDGINGSQRSVCLISHIRSIKKAADENIKQGKEPCIPKKYQQYFTLKTSQEGTKISYNYATWQLAVDEKGYSSIASSKDFGPEEVNKIYHLRDTSETQYAILKTQLGENVTRVRSTQSIRNKFLVGFIASLIRNEIMKAGKKFNLPTNQVIKDMEKIELMLQPSTKYISIHNAKGTTKSILTEWNIFPSDFDVIAADVNQRNHDTINSQIRLLPNTVQTKKTAGRPVQQKRATEDTTLKRHRGRPKGSLDKNKRKRRTVKKRIDE